MSFGPAPRQQKSWDWRAAANFACGGAGSGLIVFAVFFAPDAARAGLAPPFLSAELTLRPLLLMAGLALIVLGLLSVWLEIGRPLRALNVFLNPRTSWMSREAFAAILLLPIGAAAIAQVGAADWLSAALALTFVYCQGRMLQAAKGIPAWREPTIAPLIVVTGLAEGGALFLLGALWFGDDREVAVLVFAALLLFRAGLWLAWRRRIRAHVAPGALAAIDADGKILLLAGTALPWAALASAAAGLVAPSPSTVLLALSALLAAATGFWFKFGLLGRASFNQGFSLAHLPVRGRAR